MHLLMGRGIPYGNVVMMKLCNSVWAEYCSAVFLEEINEISKNIGSQRIWLLFFNTLSSLSVYALSKELGHKA